MIEQKKTYTDEEVYAIIKQKPYIHALRNRPLNKKISQMQRENKIILADAFGNLHKWIKADEYIVTDL